MKRRALLKGAVVLTGALSGCVQGTPVSSSDTRSCPSTVSRIENADFNGEFQMQCDRATESTTETSETILKPSTRSVSPPNADITFTLENRRDDHFNVNFYQWELQKRVESEWYGTVTNKSPANAGSSLAPGDSHTWSVSISNDNLGEQVEPVTGNESLSLRALGGGTYAFVVVGSYGEQGQSWGENQPIIGYATPFTVEGDQLKLVPTNSVTDVTREGSAVTVTVGSDPLNWEVTVTKRSETETSTARKPTTYITESVYGSPALRNILAHFDEGVEEVTLRRPDRPIGALYPSMVFSYDGTTYQVRKPN